MSDDVVTPELDSTSCSLSIRIDLPNGQRIGPGKIALLQAIDQKNSIKSACKSLGMSYPKALKLLDELNSMLGKPLTTSTHGGNAHGGTQLTETGQTVILLYQNITKTCASSASSELQKVHKLLS